MQKLETKGKRGDGGAAVCALLARPEMAISAAAGKLQAPSRGKRGGGAGAGKVARVSKGEATLALHIRAHKLPEPVREYRFAPDRKWRFDFAWPHRLLAVEVEGGVWSGGRHTRGSGYVKDMEKYNRAAVLGWCVLRFDTAQVRDGTAIAAIREALA
jgi:very-short-patch-repair endonuclease